MYNQVFISHSKDDPNLNFFYKIFAGLNTKGVWMEFEHMSSPPCNQIKKNINQSDAIFVLLSEQLLEKQHTTNWVAFEIGLACNSAFRRVDVYVFEPMSMKFDFPVPFCNYYMPYEGRSEEIIFLKELIQIAPYHQKGLPIICPHDGCHIGFGLLKNIKTIKCPACRRGIEIGSIKNITG